MLRLLENIRERRTGRSTERRPRDAAWQFGCHGGAAIGELIVRRKMIALADIIAGELVEPEGRDLQERLLQAMLMMERYRGVDAGWRDSVTQVADADISEEAMTRLADSLRVFIRTQKRHPDVGTAVWALGKLRIPGDREIYEVVLAEGSGYSKFAREQSTVALEDLRI